MKNRSLFALFMILTLSLAAQEKTETVFGRNGLKFSGIWGASSSNFSFYDLDDQGNTAFYNGGYGGLEFGRSVFVGWAGYSMRDEVDLEDVNENFSLKYNGPMLSIIPYARKVGHPRFNAVIGSGKLRIDDDLVDRVMVIQPSIGIEVNVLRWFRLGLEGGYRMVTNVNTPNISAQDVSSPFAQIDLRFGISW